MLQVLVSYASVSEFIYITSQSTFYVCVQRIAILSTYTTYTTFSKHSVWSSEQLRTLKTKTKLVVETAHMRSRMMKLQYVYHAYMSLLLGTSVKFPGYAKRWGYHAWWLCLQLKLHKEDPNMFNLYTIHYILLYANWIVLFVWREYFSTCGRLFPPEHAVTKAHCITACIGFAKKLFALSIYSYKLCIIYMVYACRRWNSLMCIRK